MLTVSLSAQEGYTPARLRGGGVPGLAQLAVGGGQVIVELTVDRDGKVTAVTPIRATPPFDDMIAAEVPAWEFSPAQDFIPARSRPGTRVPVDARVTVIAVYRPPVITGTSLGEAPKDVNAPSGRSAQPLGLSLPPFPPQAASPGVVLLEAEVDRDGHVRETKVLRSAPPFDAPARDALATWKFSPARVPAPGITYVYAIFGFPMPIGIGPGSPQR